MIPVVFTAKRFFYALTLTVVCVLVLGSQLAKSDTIVNVAFDEPDDSLQKPATPSAALAIPICYPPFFAQPTPAGMQA